MSENQDSALTPQPSIAVPSTNVSRLGAGHEVLAGMDEIEIPLAKIVQFTSDEAKADNKEERVAAGTLINSVTKKELSPYFLIIKRNPSRYIQWNPRKKEDPNFDPAFAPGAIVFQTTNARDPRVIEGKKFGPNGEAPKVTHYIEFLCYFVGEEFPLLLSFAKTSFSAGKHLNSLTYLVGKETFSTKYKITYKQEGESGNEHFVAKIVQAGIPTSDEYLTAKNWYEEYADKDVKVVEEKTEWAE